MAENHWKSSLDPKAAHAFKYALVRDHALIMSSGVENVKKLNSTWFIVPCEQSENTDWFRVNRTPGQLIFSAGWKFARYDVKAALKSILVVTLLLKRLFAHSQI